MFYRKRNFTKKLFIINNYVWTYFKNIFNWIFIISLINQKWKSLIKSKNNFTKRKKRERKWNEMILSVSWGKLKFISFALRFLCNSAVVMFSTKRDIQRSISILSNIPLHLTVLCMRSSLTSKVQWESIYCTWRSGIRMIEFF